MRDLESFYHYFCIHAKDCTAKRILKFSLGRLAKVEPEGNFQLVLEFLADNYGEYNARKTSYARGAVPEKEDAMLEALRSEFRGGHDVTNTVDDLVQYLENRNKRLGKNHESKSYDTTKRIKLSDDVFLSAFKDSDLDV